MNKCIFVLLFAQLAVSSVSATPVFFTDRSLFDAATGSGLTFEGFENPWTDTGGVADFNGFSLSESGGFNNLFHATEAGGASFSVTEGIDSVWFDDNDSSIGNLFSFTNPVSALGLDITMVGISNSLVRVSGSVTASIALVENTPAFWGVIDVDGINAISFDPSGSAFIGFDAVSYGTASAVPAPAAIWLFGSGLIGFIGMRRKSSKLLTISA